MIDSLVEDFFRRPPSSTRRRSFLHIASRRARAAFGAIPAVHFTETDTAYDVTSELPGGMDEKNVEVKFANGASDDQGRKARRKRREKEGYHMQERSFGSFERTFQVPEGVDTDKIKTSFMKGAACGNPTEEGGGPGGKKGRRQGRLIWHDFEKHDPDFSEHRTEKVRDRMSVRRRQC